MRHFYVVFLTPSGPGAMFVSSQFHPLHPNFIGPLMTQIARSSSLQGVLVQSNQVLFTSIIELESEVVAARAAVQKLADAPTD